MSTEVNPSTLEAVRRNLCLLSSAILLYVIGGGAPTSDGKLTLPFISITMSHPERMVYVIWFLFFWWLYRYFQMGALSTHKKNLRMHMTNLLTKSPMQVRVKQHYAQYLKSSGLVDEIMSTVPNAPRDSFEVAQVTLDPSQRRGFLVQCKCFSQGQAKGTPNYHLGPHKTQDFWLHARLIIKAYVIHPEQFTFWIPLLLSAVAMRYLFCMCF